jgi:tetratricopeptide (TPR) repeat protein
VFNARKAQQVLDYLSAIQDYKSLAENILDLTQKIESQEHWQLLHKAVLTIPPEVRLEMRQAAEAYVHTLMGLRQVDDLSQFALLVNHKFDVATNARIQVHLSLALLLEEKNEEALDILENALFWLEGAARGVALRRMGFLKARLGYDWVADFEAALELQQGRAYGLTLLDFATTYAKTNQPKMAYNLYNQALPFFKRDPFHLAWLYYNLGTTALRLEQPEAEVHFLLADKLSRKPQASGLRSAALRGLAAFRRSKGEFTRAEFLLHQAIACATEPDDEMTAQQGLARVLRLAGNPRAALEVIEEAIFKHTALPALLVTKAITYLALGQDEAAQANLQNAHPLHIVTSQHLVLVVRAELERRAGRHKSALQILKTLPLNTLQAAEERRAFPLLFGLLSTQPAVALEYYQTITVKVHALGVLRVLVNGRAVPIAPSSRSGELLVFLLEQDGVCNLERLLDALYPEANSPFEQNKARKALWKLTRDLRQALGWQDSIVSLGAAYQLDPKVFWDYDAKNIAQSRFFLSGVYSSWVLEKAQNLSF